MRSTMDQQLALTRKLTMTTDHINAAFDSLFKTLGDEIADTPEYVLEALNHAHDSYQTLHDATLRYIEELQAARH